MQKKSKSVKNNFPKNVVKIDSGDWLIPIICNQELRDKLRHVTNFKSLFEQKSIWLWQHQTGSGWEHSTGRSPGKDPHKESVEAKKGNLIGYDLKQRWLFVIVWHFDSMTWRGL